MQALIPFPDIDPAIFTIGLFGMEFSLRWYALAYIAGILAGWRIGVTLAGKARLWPGDKVPMSRDQGDDMLTWIVLGIILGGRLGYVLFYKPAYYWANPAEIIRLWDGGMAFHGGLLGVVIGVWIFCARNAISKINIADLLAVCVPPGLFFGRIANFINAELYGRPTDVAWGVKFPSMCFDPIRQGCAVAGEWFYTGAEVARHPSQLYEAGLEGLLLGAIVLVMALKGSFKVPGLTVGVFFAGYGISRFIVEFYRLADAQFMTPDNPAGHVMRIGEWGITKGQQLSLPMVALGLGLILYALLRRRRAAAA
ncbi:prolipoprotein diacylglyceryl transferase [Vannielia litorea]|uniref:Phosphatidylglycerol--prolipoprotein diacylglyceryl transferase n=1 Tax=Vannielia litorea TaxID=1217970 RepID=A0A1N6GPD5_9RHOB|nr:prolipoprotein diacylglyceryl transferase [Vannielia litorea]SIO09327.1 Prolipoprotein diacylglyceryl transferase [Vannielia litorea]